MSGPAVKRAPRANPGALEGWASAPENGAGFFPPHSGQSDVWGGRYQRPRFTINVPVGVCRSEECAGRSCKLLGSRHETCHKILDINVALRLSSEWQRALTSWQQFARWIANKTMFCPFHDGLGQARRLLFHLCAPLSSARLITQRLEPESARTRRPLQRGDRGRGSLNNLQTCAGLAGRRSAHL